MAVPHFSVSIVARGSGRSAVLSAAYRHCAKMDYEREGRTIDYTRKQGLLHEEFVLPADAPAWLRSMIADRPVSGASEAFWNRVEGLEKRLDAQLAKDVTIALPVELSTNQNIELVRDFVARHITAQGMVADWVFHDAPGNPHVHLMTTLRPLTEDGFGPKKVPLMGSDGQVLRNQSGKILYQPWAGGVDDFNAFRSGWFACQNQHLARAGLDIRVDGRSFEKQGIALAPTIHLGIGTKAIERKAISGEGSAERTAVLERLELQDERRTENARRIERNPALVLDLITREKSVFDQNDIARVLHRYIDEAHLFQNLMARIVESPQVVRLDRERIDFATGIRTPTKYTTHALIRLEAEMANRASWLSRRHAHGVRPAVLETMFGRHKRLSDEQRAAVEHVAGEARIAAVIGRAGAGKTTMMKAAREAWEAAGYRVVGGALAGKAAEGLQNEAGIPSRTLSSWELLWGQGRGQPDKRTVFVLDEAGMVSSRQMALFVETVTRTGAKLVLVGDPDQLQPIEAGAAFRAITDRIGYAELDTIYRQQEPWMRDASLDLARGRVGRAIEAYQVHGKMEGFERKADAVTSLIADWNRDYDQARSILILAHLRRDVQRLNELARGKLIERGVIGQGSAFQTNDGVRCFGAGEQIVFLKNDASLGVKNGMLGKVLQAAPGRILVETGTGDHRAQVLIEQRFYNSVDHGYATTIHKSQGATVDRVKLLASLSLDRHLTYVAMTRHREDLSVYYGRRSFAKAGGLVDRLSRRNSKETTLDYADGRSYANALRFAETRGLHLVNVARTVARDRLAWTVRQKQRLADLAVRLMALGLRLGFGSETTGTISMASQEVKPMIAGISTFATSIHQAIEDKLAADPVLKTLWQDVLMRFDRVYAKPEAAFDAVNVDAMLRDRATAAKTRVRIAAEPQVYGALKGKTGILATGNEKSDRDLAVRNARPLADAIGDYIRLRDEAERRYHAEELTIRYKAALDIPDLTTHARTVLERVRHAMDRNDPPQGLKDILADDQVKAELDAFAKAVAERFGERTFLPRAAMDAEGDAFKRVTAGMNAAQTSEIARAWSMMRTIQQLSAHERSVTALKATEAMRRTKAQGLRLS